MEAETLRRMFLLLLVALQATAGAASGAPAAPLEGEVSFRGAAWLEGALGARAPLAVVNLTPAVLAGEPVALSWGAASSYAVNRTFLAHVAPTNSGVEPEETNRSASHGAGAVSSLRCRERCKVVLVVLDAPGLAAEAPADAASWTREETRFWGGWAHEGRNAFRALVPAGALRLAGADLLDARGEVALLLDGVAFDLVDERGARRVTTGPSAEPGAGGSRLVQRLNDSFVVLRASDARLDPLRGTKAAAHAWTLDLSVDGSVEAREARGWVSLGGARVALDGERLRVEGAPLLRLRTDADGVALEGPVSLREPRGDATLGGAATRVLVDGAALAPVPARSDAGAQAAGAAGLLLVALVLLRQVAWLPLYSRVTRSRVLANENRQRVFDAIADRPGLTAADLSRRLGLARVVVEHHLRMLEAHRMVTSRRLGRPRGYFLPEARVLGEGADGAILLRDATRRRLAEALSSAPDAMSQEELAERLCLSRRLVGYHLQRFAQAGLATALDGPPRRYRATTRLHDLVLPAAGGNGAT